MNSAIYLIPSEAPKILDRLVRSTENTMRWSSVSAFEALIFFVEESEMESLNRNVLKIFPHAHRPQSFDQEEFVVVRAFKAGVSNPVTVSLSQVLGVEDSKIRVDKLLLGLGNDLTVLDALNVSWREPAIEELRVERFSHWLESNLQPTRYKSRYDNSWDLGMPSEFNLEFEEKEWTALHLAAHKQGRSWNHAELEVFAQTWSEHCKHKIFAADVRGKDLRKGGVKSLFGTYIRKPTLDMMAGSHQDICLSVFHDNAGVLRVFGEQGEKTDWAVCLKMETHNSPSAISPYGGASTGIVGVHRDILGTGQGAMPIANWDVLCFESPSHEKPRPQNALHPDIIRVGVLKGIEDGGNQSGIPTVQGSVVFDPGYAVKPLVYAGSVGLMPLERVHKKPQPGLKMYCIGGAVGADGLHGAVMSSRDLREVDFSGSMVQVANAFTQRRMTDFLLVARDRNLLDVITDNGAGGLASSCGEMAGLTNGARIELSKLRTKFEGLLAWEHLLSESQERMTLATHNPEALESLAEEWGVPLDPLGELNESGYFEVEFHGRTLVKIPLKVLHDGCPQLKLQTEWTYEKENVFLKNQRLTRVEGSPCLEDFSKMLSSEHLCSREFVVRRFDHEVQGRTLRKPFAGHTQGSAQDGSAIEIYESQIPANVVLSHGLAPWRGDIEENTLHSFDEALRSAILAGARIETLGGLDNFCWPDPLKSERHLWRLVKSCECLETLCRGFGIPLISGKDSMKNNSKEFEVPATIVVSMGGSTHPKENFPVGFFARANEVLYFLPPIGATLRDSAWERVFEARVPGAEEMFKGKDSEARLQELFSFLAPLKLRYTKLSELIAQGLIRSAKDISEGGLLHAVFEMCLGRRIGVHFEDPKMSETSLFEEGLGGIVLGVDPHVSSRVEAFLPGLRRLGVSTKSYSLYWSKSRQLDLTKLEADYTKRGSVEGFWS